MASAATDDDDRRCTIVSDFGRWLVWVSRRHGGLVNNWHRRQQQQQRLGGVSACAKTIVTGLRFKEGTAKYFSLPAPCVSPIAHTSNLCQNDN
jgi:hypothetical protein